MSKSTTSLRHDLETVVDAVARGRLTPCDVAGITDAELEVLFAIGQNKLETGQHEQANQFFTALVTLMPYRARFWRALGISAHHLGAFLEARRAYEAALYLDPEHQATACWAAQVCVLLGENLQAQYWLEQAESSNDPDVQKLIHLLRQPSYVQQIQQLFADFKLQSEDKDTQTQVKLATFTTSDGQKLPLENSVWHAQQTLEITRTQPLNLRELTNAAGQLEPEVPTEARTETVTHTFAPQKTVTTRMTPVSKTRTSRLTSTAGVRPARTHSPVRPEATAARRLGLIFLDDLTPTKTQKR